MPKNQSRRAAETVSSCNEMDFNTLELVNTLVNILSTNLISKGDDQNEKKISDIRTCIN